MVIEELLEKLVKDGGSDLHISSNLPPSIRIDGKLTRVDMEPLTPDEVESLLFPMLSNEQRRKLEQEWELDFSYGIEGFFFDGGKILHPVREMVITGNMIHLWNRLRYAGSDARDCTRWQIPTICFDEVDFSG